MSKGDSKNAKKKNNKKTSKNKSSLSRGNKKKPGMPNVSNDLSQKLYATMEKHKEVRVDSMRNVFYFSKEMYKALILQTELCPVNYTSLAGELSGLPKQTSTSKSGCSLLQGQWE